jgi:hypothetical protein
MRGAGRSRVSCLPVTCLFSRAGGGIRTHIDRITGAAPFCVEPRRRQQECKESNPAWLFWRQPAPQEHTPVNQQCVWRELNPAPRGSQPRMQNLYTTDTAEGVGVEPTRPFGSRAFQARPVTSRVAHPILRSPGRNRTASLLRVGEASSHSTTGLSRQCPGQESNPDLLVRSEV